MMQWISTEGVEIQVQGGALRELCIVCVDSDGVRI